MNLHVRTFDDSDIEAAGRLLAGRHRAHRQHEPLLAARFGAEEHATAEVAAAWTTEGASGAIALVDGRPVGYLLGTPKSDSPWGPSVWMESAGLGVEDAETARDLYGVAAARWVEEGRLAHYALVPSHDTALVDAFFRLAFGLQQVHGIREPLTDFADPTVRRAARGDLAAIAAAAMELPAHQSRSPVFASGPGYTYEEALAEAAEDLDNPEFATFVAERDGRVAGVSQGCSITMSSAHTGPARPDSAALMGFAAVMPDARGTGAGRAIGDAVLAWAAEAGYQSVVTDWRATNLLSSRAWPRLGFRPTFFRLHRMVGH